MASPRPALAADAPSRPNVLFIAVDDLNDWIGCLGGHPLTRTPNLDRLARSGVLFTNAHCAAPACNPSRAALLSGVPPHRSGILYNDHKMRTICRTRSAAPPFLEQRLLVGGLREDPALRDRARVLGRLFP